MWGQAPDNFQVGTWVADKLAILYEGSSIESDYAVRDFRDVPTGRAQQFDGFHSNQYNPTVDRAANRECERREQVHMDLTVHHLENGSPNCFLRVVGSWTFMVILEGSS